MAALGKLRRWSSAEECWHGLSLGSRGSVPTRLCRLQTLRNCRMQKSYSLHGSLAALLRTAVVHCWTDGSFHTLTFSCFTAVQQQQQQPRVAMCHTLHAVLPSCCRLSHGCRACGHACKPQWCWYWGRERCLWMPAGPSGAGVEGVRGACGHACRPSGAGVGGVRGACGHTCRPQRCWCWGRERCLWACLQTQWCWCWGHERCCALSRAAGLRWWASACYVCLLSLEVTVDFFYKCGCTAIPDTCWISPFYFTTRPRAAFAYVYF